MRTRTDCPECGALVSYLRHLPPSPIAEDATWPPVLCPNGHVVVAETRVLDVFGAGFTCTNGDGPVLLMVNVGDLPEYLRPPPPPDTAPATLPASAPARPR